MNPYHLPYGEDDEQFEPKHTINGFPIAPIKAPDAIAPAGTPGPKSDFLKTVDEMRTNARGLEDFDFAKAQQSRTLSDGAADVSDALYSAFSRTPLAKARGGDPVADMKERSAFKTQGEDRATAAAKEAARQKTIREENDPQSETSKSTSALVEKFLPEFFQDLGSTSGRMSHAKWVQMLPFIREFAKKKAAAPEKVLTDLEREEKEVGIDLKKSIAEKNRRVPPPKEPKKGGKEGGAQIPAGVATDIGQLGTGDTVLNDLSNAWGDKAGYASFLTKHLPATDATQFGDNRLAAAQVVGTILEGGKLTDSDLKDKYFPLMPDVADSKARKDNKISILRGMLAAKKASMIDGLTRAGYNTSGFNKPSAIPAPQSIADAPLPQQGYSQKTNKTYTFAADGKTVVKTEEGDTRGK